ncbi:MAG: phage tail protein [Anaerolinea sp.]|nr:phage tail protein [Anaerolinea sp.]
MAAPNPIVDALKSTSLQTARAHTNPTFRFVVDIANLPQAVFTECTLPVIEWDITEIKEGGLNGYVHQLPGRRKTTRITLKNGLGTSALLDWYIDALDENFKRRKVTIKLLNAKEKLQKPIMTWDIEDAYPIKWTGPQLNSGENTIAIQTLELACNRVSLTRHTGS